MLAIYQAFVKTDNAENVERAFATMDNADIDAKACSPRVDLNSLITA